MHLSPTATASDTPVPTRSGAQLLARLESAREVVEGRFLEAGDVLSRAVEGVGALIAGLDGMRDNLDTETVATTTADLARAAESLNLLPESLDERRARVAELVRFSDSLTGCIEDMRQHLAYLRVFAINIKITSGGIAAAGPEFAIFAQEIYDCIEMGRTLLDGLNTNLTALDRTLRGALIHENALARDCMALLPAVPDALTGSATAIAAHHARIASVTVDAAALAREVQKKVGAGLAALQIGDITRQRIEHVQAGLRELDEAPEFDALADEARGRARAFTCRLLAAQLAATAEAFHRDVSRIGENVTGMAADASELLRLRDLAYGQSDGADANFLKTLEGTVGQALGLVDDVTNGEQAAEDVSRSAAAAVRGLTDRIASIQNIRADVQMMALNTTLKCARIGDTGKPLGVIAIELRQHANHLEKSAAETLTALDGLFAAAEAVRRGPGHDADERKAAAAATVLTDAVSRIGKAGDGVESALAAAARQGAGVVDLLRSAAGRFDFQRQIGVVLDEAADELSGMAGDGAVAVDIAPALRSLMARLAKQYTMAQEREVHRRETEALGEEESAPAAGARALQKDLEDAFL
jgi:hypothetical protein